MKTSESSLLVERLRLAGFTLAADGSRLRVAPADSLTDELRESIREHRAGIISILAAEAAPAAERHPSTTQAHSVPPAPRKPPQRVSCGACSHFLPGLPLPGESLGACSLTMTGLPPAGGSGHGAPYPTAPRQCPSYEQRSEP